MSTTPAPGFYYHYKHDPAGPLENYAYEVVGVGNHTEEDTRFVIYRPLYESAYVYQHGKMFDVRPLAMFMEEMEQGGKRLPRFAPITDPNVVEELLKQRHKMYGV